MTLLANGHPYHKFYTWNAQRKSFFTSNITANYTGHKYKRGHEKRVKIQFLKLISAKKFFLLFINIEILPNLLYALNTEL